MLKPNDILIYTRTTSNGNTLIKTGVVDRVIKKRSGGEAYKVSPLGQQSKTTVQVEDLVPVVAYVSKETAAMLTEGGHMLNVVPEEEQKEEQLTPCDMGACPTSFDEEE